LFVLDNRQNNNNLIIYFTFFVQHLTTLWWIGSWQKDADPFLMTACVAFCLVHPFYYLIPLSIYKYIKKSSSSYALLAFPFIMAFYEWGKSLTELSFPWISNGYALAYDKYFSQIADIGGVWLSGFVIYAVNVLIYYIYKSYIQSPKDYFKSFTFKKSIAVLALLLIIPYTYGIIRVEQYSNIKPKKEISAAIIQPNINPWHKWSRDVFRSIKDHIDIQDSLLKVHKKIDLAVWSETSITYFSPELNSRPYNLDLIKEYLDYSNTSIISGFTELFFFRDGEKPTATAEKFMGDSSRLYQSYNSAIMVNPSKYNDTIQIYRKMKLTPFSERIPFIDYISFAKDMLKWDVGISNWGLGYNQMPLELITDKGKTNIAVIICIESIYPDFVRKFAHQSGIFSIITNDAWYNHTFGPYQHYAIAQMRAIENKRYIIRSANSGISGFISPTGESLKEAKHYTNDGIFMKVPEINDLTLYSIYGDWFAYATVIMTVFFFYRAYIIRKKSIIKLDQ